MGRWLFFIALIACFVAGPSPVQAKIYIWTDEEHKTHYCNDPDDVPPEYKDSLRTIESAASSNKPAERTSTEPQNVQASPVAPPSPQAARPSSGIGEELNELMQSYRAMRDELKEYRKSGKDVKSPEYNDLKMQLVEIKKKINEVQIKNRNRAN